jgi:hypothetical protein
MTLAHLWQTSTVLCAFMPVYLCRQHITGQNSYADQSHVNAEEDMLFVAGPSPEIFVQLGWTFSSTGLFAKWKPKDMDNQIMYTDCSVAVPSSFSKVSKSFSGSFHVNLWECFFHPKYLGGGGGSICKFNFHWPIMQNCRSDFLWSDAMFSGCYNLKSHDITIEIVHWPGTFCLHITFEYTTMR